MLLIEVWDEAGDIVKDIPADYEFLPAGDAGLTRAVKAAAADYPMYVLMRQPSKR